MKDVDCPLFKEVEVAEEEEELVGEELLFEGCGVNKASSASGPLTTIDAGLFAPEYWVTLKA